MYTELTAFIAIVAIASVLAMGMKALRQPLIIAYMLTGIVVGPVGLSLVGHGELLEIFSSLGVSSLLFLVGLGINPKYIRDVGAVAVITGVAQIVFTSLAGLLLALALGYGFVASLYIAIAFTLSSTIVVLRLLREKEDEDSLYGRIAVGFLLVQDLFAMAVFLFLSSGGGGSWLELIALLLVKFTVLGAAAFVIIRFVLPRIEGLIADNRELLLLASFSFCLVCAWGFQAIGFSYELGALSAGIVLSWSRLFREVASRIEPIRDVFLVLFFVTVGANLTIAGLHGLWLPVLVFSAFILLGNPLIVYVIMIVLKYTPKTAFFAGLTVAQISEFSLIMMALGLELGHITPHVLTLATMVGMITIAGSSYMMTYNERLYAWLEPFLLRVTPPAPRVEPIDAVAGSSFEILLFGAHRLGGGVLELAQTEGISHIVVDFDPHLIKQLQARHVPARFASADDSVFLDSLDASELKLVISTIPDFEINRFQIGYWRARKPDVTVIVIAHHASQARELYALGADYVVMPPYLGRRFVVDLFKKNLFAHNKYAQEKKRHVRDLQYFFE